MKQKVLFEHILNTDGEIVIEKYYDPEADKQTLTRILLNFNGEVKYLKRNSDLLTILQMQCIQGDIFSAIKIMSQLKDLPTADRKFHWPQCCTAHI